MSLVVRLFVVILVAWLVPVLIVFAVMEPPVSSSDGWVIVPMAASLAAALWAGQRWFAKPLAGLSGAAGRWRAGNVAVRSDASADAGEIGTLARTFNEMAGSAASVAQQLDSARAELRRAEAQARQVAEATARTLSAASHDLRQPLQAMNLSVSLLASRHRADNDTAALGRIARSIQQLGHQIDLIVQTTRLQAGLLVPKLVDVPLQPLIDAVTSEFREVFEQKSLVFVNAVCGETVRSDPQLLTPILRSFLANAVRFTPAGGSIRVDCETHGQTLRLTVRDSGVGMALDRRAEVKAALEADADAGRNATAVGAGGTSDGLGTGLTLVRQGAHLLGHAVGFESTLGEGSSFHLEMPRVVVGSTPSSPAHAMPGVAEPLPSLRGRLLLVEDDAQSEDGTAEALRATGLKVVSALELEDALDTLEGDVEGDVDGDGDVDVDVENASPAAGEGSARLDGTARPVASTFDKAGYDALVVRRPPADARELDICRSLRTNFPAMRMIVVVDAAWTVARQPLLDMGVVLLEAPSSASVIIESLAPLASSSD